MLVMKFVSLRALHSLSENSSKTARTDHALRRAISKPATVQETVKKAEICGH